MYHSQLREIKHVGDMRENSVSKFWPSVHDIVMIRLQILYQIHVLWSEQHLRILFI